MISFLKRNVIRDFRIRPKAEWADVRDEVRRALKDLRQFQKAMPSVQSKEIIFRGGSTNVEVEFDVDPLACRIGRIEGELAPGSAVEAAASVTAATDLVWQWNGTDLTEFTNGATPELDTSGGATVAVVTSHRGQAALRFTAGGAGYSQWCITPANLGITLPTRYVLEIDYEQADDGVGGKSPGSRLGLSQFCRFISSGNVLAYSLCQYGSAESFLQVWTRTTTFSNSGTTPGGRRPGTASPRGAKHRFEIVHTLGSTYDLAVFCQLRNSGGSLLADTYASEGGTGTQMDVDSGRYDDETPNTVGVAASWTAADHFFDVTRIALKRYPGDETSAVSTAATTTTIEPPGLSVDWTPINDGLRRGVVLRSVSGLTTDTDYRITLVVEGRP